MMLYNGSLAAASPSNLLGLNWNNFVLDSAVMNQTNISGFSKLSAYPDGYYPPQSMIPARSAGRIRSNFTINGAATVSGALQQARELLATTGVAGSGGITNADLGQLIQLVASIVASGGVTSAQTDAIANILASISGSGDITATISGFVDLVAAIMSTGTITANNTFLADLEADITSTGDALTAQTIRDAVWAAVLESGYSASDILRLIAAATQGSATGLEDGSPVFKSMDGTIDRITATYSAGTRTVTDRDAG